MEWERDFEHCPSETLVKPLKLGCFGPLKLSPVCWPPKIQSGNECLHRNDCFRFRFLLKMRISPRHARPPAVHDFWGEAPKWYTSWSCRLQLTGKRPLYYFIPEIQICHPFRDHSLYEWQILVCFHVWCFNHLDRVLPLLKFRFLYPYHPSNFSTTPSKWSVGRLLSSKNPQFSIVYFDLSFFHYVYSIHMEVSWNRGIPKSCIYRWDFPWSKHHPAIGLPPFWETSIFHGYWTGDIMANTRGLTLAQARASTASTCLAWQARLRGVVPKLLLGEDPPNDQQKFGNLWKPRKKIEKAMKAMKVFCRADIHRVQQSWAIIRSDDFGS